MFQYMPLLSLIQQQDDLIALVGGLVGALIGLVVGLVLLIAMWKIFTKAGKPGWAVLIPFYNLYIMLEIVGRPGWWLILMLIPLVNFVFMLILAFDIAKAFGKGSGFALGLIFFYPIFVLILAFGDAQYVGPVAAS
jgi:hypothetical protein